MGQQIGRILVDPDRAGLAQFVGAVAAADAQGAAARRHQHVQMLSPTTTAVSIGPAEPLRRGKEQVGIGLGRQTDRSMPSLSSASFQASTC